MRRATRCSGQNGHLEKVSRYFLSVTWTFFVPCLLVVQRSLRRKKKTKQKRRWTVCEERESSSFPMGLSLGDSFSDLSTGQLGLSGRLPSISTTSGRSLPPLSNPLRIYFISERGVARVFPQPFLTSLAQKTRAPKIRKISLESRVRAHVKKMSRPSGRER